MGYKAQLLALSLILYTQNLRAQSAEPIAQKTMGAPDAPVPEQIVIAPELNEDEALDDEAQLNEKLAEDVPDNSDALSTDVDRWVLHDVLVYGGVAQSATVENVLASQTTQSLALDWTSRLSLAQTEQLLRGEPTQHHAVDVSSIHFDIPLANHPLVDLYIDYFTGRGRWFFEKWLSRSGALIPLMRPILASRGVPEDLVYLAMIESGFSPKAYSTAAASGYWQFIPGTGRLFGLRNDLFVDERRDFIRSTEAAARYLAALHRSLGDWHLAWASYNAGEGRIRRALHKTHTTNFWQLAAHKGAIAKETVHYVPKIIAAAIIAKDAARYGFVPPKMAPLTFDTVDIEGALDLAQLARAMKIDANALRQLNPSLIYGVTPPGRRSQIRVPEGLSAGAALAVAKLPVAKRITTLSYRVRRGDTLIGIARRTQSSVETLRQFNHLKGRPIRPGQQLLVPDFKLTAPVVAQRPKRAKKSRATVAAVSKSRHTLVAARDKNSGRRPRARHVVSHGDTLWSIARRYQVPMAAIRSHKRRAGDRLAVGEVLDIF